jgi:hypothetical protein
LALHLRLPGLGPPIKIVDFDDAVEPLTSRANHRPAQLGQQISRRVIAPQSQYPLHAQGADPTFLADHVPDCFEPDAQRQMRVRK